MSWKNPVFIIYSSYARHFSLDKVLLNSQCGWRRSFPLAFMLSTSMFISVPLSHFLFLMHVMLKCSGALKSVQNALVHISKSTQINLILSFSLTRCCLTPCLWAVLYLCLILSSWGCETTALISKSPYGALKIKQISFMYLLIIMSYIFIIIITHLQLRCK